MTTEAVRWLGAIIIFTVAALVVLNIYLPGDNSALTKDILTIVVPTTAGILAWINSTRNTVKIADVEAKQDTLATVVVDTKAGVDQATEQLVTNTEKLDGLAEEMNGKLAALMKANVAAARLLGHDEGEQAERDRQAS